jgi:SAM-dependent methyltransferase
MVTAASAQVDRQSSASALEREITRLLGGALNEARLTRLGAGLKELHARFVSEQAHEASGDWYLESPAHLAAYLSYFFPASEAQVRRALAEVPPPASPRWRVLDIGSGPGPAAFAVAAWAASAVARVEVTALEASAAALETMKRLWEPAAGGLTTRVWTAGAALPEGPFDVVVLSHALNELFVGDPHRLDKRHKLMTELAARIGPGGYLVLVEPALKRTGREMLVVRDRLLNAGMIARAPCLFQGACPAIARPRDWCHADRPWVPPPLVEHSAAAAGLSRESLKYAYVILSPASASSASPCRRTASSASSGADRSAGMR